MAAFDKCNADGVYDEREPPFTNDEIEAAFELRQRTSPDPRLARKDRCPHTPMCPNILDCIEAIAWYRRHQRVIEARLAAEEGRKDFLHDAHQFETRPQARRPARDDETPI